jgi:hypothetical protein
MFAHCVCVRGFLTIVLVDEQSFGDTEAAFNVFDERTGPNNDKWCCGTSFPQIVGAAMETGSYVLTKFTITSNNDAPRRDPRVWQIEGCASNCGDGVAGSGW